MTADKAGEICQPMTTEEIVAALNKGVEYLKDRDELQHTFDLRWKASMRAIKLWQKKTGRKLVWPDHCDMVVWLLEQLDEKRKLQKAVIDLRIDELRMFMSVTEIENPLLAIDAFCERYPNGVPGGTVEVDPQVFVDDEKKKPRAKGLAKRNQIAP
jgi:hypothetical protein